MANIKLSNNQYWDMSNIVFNGTHVCPNDNLDLIVEHEEKYLGMVIYNDGWWRGTIFTNNGSPYTDTVSSVARSGCKPLYGGATSTFSIGANNYIMCSQGYVRFQSGLQIMWKPFNTGASSEFPALWNNSQANVGGFGRGVDYSGGNFTNWAGTSKAFASAPMVFATGIKANKQGYEFDSARWYPLMGIYNVTASSWGMLRAHYPAGETENANCYGNNAVTLVAIGRWK